MHNNNLFIGLMSGTSLDGIDAALVSLADQRCQLLATHHTVFSQDFREEILALCQPGHNGIARMGQMSVRLGQRFAESVHALLEKSEYTAEAITAIGCHGQTIRHHPNDEYPFTLQIGDPNIIAANTGITTVADFRRRDMALGGQGAPLAPAFHAFLLKNIPGAQWMLNLGGIANLTHLSHDHSVTGFDTGPGNTLIDAWCQRCLKRPFDNNGQWAKTGTVHQGLLATLLEDPYFQLPPPKSTGREYFNLHWLKQAVPSVINPEDLQATLVELTAKSIANAIVASSSTARQIWVCGGGSKNRYLIDRLQAHCPQHTILTTDAIGIPADWIEACLCAWLARRTLQHRSGNLPAVTGASRESVLGAVYY